MCDHYLVVFFSSSLSDIYGICICLDSYGHTSSRYLFIIVAKHMIVKLCTLLQMTCEPMSDSKELLLALDASKPSHDQNEMNQVSYL